MQFNLAQRELTLKVVYYGAALSGKTTNLQAVHQMVPSEGAGRLMTLETRDDRTLFFDLLPIFFRTRSGYKVKLRLFTVPGQTLHDSTRKVVLQGADAVVFVADSQVSASELNKESFRNLRDNLSANGLDVDTIPLVIQFNKRDLPNVRSDDELRALEERRRTPVYRAVAVQGQGVLETLRGLLGLTWDSLEASYEIGVKLQTDRDTFMEQVFQGWDAGRLRGGLYP